MSHLLSFASFDEIRQDAFSMTEDEQEQLIAHDVNHYWAIHDDAFDVLSSFVHYDDPMQVHYDDPMQVHYDDPMQRCG
jgi:hypothetical protein